MSYLSKKDKEIWDKCIFSKSFYWDRIGIALAFIFCFVALVVAIFFMFQFPDLRKNNKTADDIIENQSLNNSQPEELATGIVYYTLSDNYSIYKKMMIEYTQKHYKIGDRIKIYDMNYMTKDCSRLSIIEIGTINKIIDDKIYGDWGDYCLTCGDTTWDVVRSNREWKDLVDLQMQNKLN